MRWCANLERRSEERNMRIPTISYALRMGIAGAALMAGMSIISTPAAAQSAPVGTKKDAAVATPRLADGNPDLNGVWASDATFFYKKEEGNKVSLLQFNRNPDVLDDPELTKTRALNQVEGAEKRVE